MEVVLPIGIGCGVVQVQRDLAGEQVRAQVRGVVVHGDVGQRVRRGIHIGRRGSRSSRAVPVGTAGACGTAGMVPTGLVSEVSRNAGLVAS